MKKQKTRSVAAIWIVVAAAFLCQGCQFLQNEFFTIDRAAPDSLESRAPSGIDVPDQFGIRSRQR